jgi:hypothetical protein
MLSIAGPKGGLILYGGCGDQCVPEPDVMTLTEVPEEIAGLPACLAIDLNAEQGLEQPVQQIMFGRQSASPKFSGCYRRVQDGRLGIAQLQPARDDALVSSATHLNEDVGIDEDGHLSLSRRLSCLSLRIYSAESSNSDRSFHIPTTAFIARSRSSAPLR